MKIAFFIEDYVKGGQNVVVANLINSWPNANTGFIVVSNKDNPGLDLIKNRLHRPCKFKLYQYNRMVHVRSPALSHPAVLLGRILLLLCKYPVFILQTFLILYLLRTINPDKLIVSNGGYPGAQACRAASMTGLFHQKWGKPLFIYHNLPIKPHFSLIPIEYIIDWLIEKSVEKLITVSHASQSKIINRRGLCYSEKLSVIYNGISKPKVSSMTLPLKEELKLSPDTKLLLTIANFEKRKGHEFLLTVFSKVTKSISNVHLLLVGTGDRQIINNILKQTHELRVNEFIHVLGFRDDIPELLHQIDVLAVPSQEYESFGLVIVEAMAQRIPVVATNVGGIPEVVENGTTGYVCDRSDANEFAAKIIYLLRDGSKRRQLGNEGYVRFKKLFTADEMAKKYYHLIN